MSANAFNCPSSCEDQLAEIGFNSCGPALRDDGFIALLLARAGYGFANIEDPAEHTTRTDETSSDSDAVRRLYGVGAYSPEYGSATSIGRLKIPGKSTASFTFKVYDNTPENYEFARSLGCYGTYQVWRIGTDGTIYGGNDGIAITLNAREPMTEDVTGRKYIEITGSYDYVNMDPRDDYPLFDELDGLI